MSQRTIVSQTEISVYCQFVHFEFVDLYFCIQPFRNADWDKIFRESFVDSQHSTIHR